MSISQAQYVDLLVKQLYGVAKTDTDVIKSPSNESIASPALIRGDTQWTQSNQIPATAAAVANIVQAYTGINAIQCSPDTTTVPIGGVYPTWLTNLTNWIPQQFGSSYIVQVWVDSPGVSNPTLTGTQIFAAGSGGTGEYYFNSIAGLLNFIGGTIPAPLTSSKVIYIVGYRYIGLVGVTNLPSNLAIGNLNFTGTTISSTSLNGNIILTPNGSGIVQVSSALTSNANITANFFIGNGSQLSGVAASNAVTSGTVTNNAQPNITSVGTLTSLNISGNLTAGNLIGVFANGNSNVSIPSANGNVNISAVGNANVLVVTGTGANIAGTANITGTLSLGGGSGGNLTGANNISANTISGNLTTNAQPNITSVGTLTGLTVSGTTNLGSVGNVTITGGSTGYYLQTNGSGSLSWAAIPVGSGISNGTSNVSIPVSNGNVNLTAGGNTTLVVTSTGANIAGTANVSGNANVGNLGTGGLIVATGNITGGNLTTGGAVVATGNGTFGNISTTGTGGNIYGANNISANTFTGTLTTAAQPNITSVGTLSSLTVSGTTNLGSVGNVTITGGSTGYYLQTNGSGSLSWSAIPVGSGISNGTSNVSIPTINGNVNLTAGGNTSLVVTSTGANITGTANISGNANVGNIGALAGIFTTVAGSLITASQPNITSVGTLTSLAVTGNITSGNANLGNSVTANYFVGSLYGTANLATYATTANSVAGANVSGAVAYATTANSVAGANVSGAVAYATTANSVAGANVSGQVAFAATANSVAGANVSGQVANALVAGTVYTNSQPNITSVGSLTGLTVSNATGVVNFTNTANVSLGAVANVHITGGTSGYVLQTDGSGNLSWVGISTSSISNGNSNVSIPSANGNVNLSASGNANVLVVTGTGTNINGYANVSGNLNVGNVVAGNGTGGSIIGANLMSATYLTGTLTTNAQPNITSTGTLTSLNVSGTSNLGPVGNVTITGGSTGYYLQTNGSGGLSWSAIPVGTGISNGTSNVNIPTINGNVNLSVGGNANVLVVTGTGANIAGTLNVTGNIGTSGNITASRLISNIATGTAPLVVTSTTQVANLNVATAGTVLTNSQPNITSVGTLTGLNVSGPLVANTFQMGYGVYAFYSTSVFFATTASTSPNQVLWNYLAADLTAIDFTIIATNSTGLTRQTCKISAAILGTTVTFNEYGGLYINGGVGSFSVVYNGGGATPTLDLIVTPDSSAVTEYNMLISKYLV